MADHPLDCLLHIFAPVVEALEKLAPAQAIRAAYNRDYDRAVCRAADALAEDEAEYEALEPYDELPEMDWLGWAVPAILTELYTHRPIEGHDGRVYCHVEPGQLCHDIYADYDGWMHHVAPLIAKRIGCDPLRATEALLRYKPDKVNP